VNTDLLKEAPKTLKQAESRLPEMSEIKSCSIRFSKIPKEFFPKGSDQSQITLHSIDMSYRLEQLLETQKLALNLSEKSPMNLLCELQFAFVCFLIGHAYDAFEQWKLFTNLICNSEKAIQLYPDLFIQFIQTVYFQIKELPEDFFTDVITSNNFLIVNLHNLFDNIKSSSKSKVLTEKCEKFKKYLQEKFEFDFEQEPDEYAPTICDDVQ
jgi:A1 cistron-splicing factor AAR2